MENNFEIRDNGLFFNGEFVAPFYPRIVEKRLILDKMANQISREYDLEIIFPNKGSLEKHTFTNLKKIEYSEYWDECCDEELTKSQKRMLKIYLQKSLNNITYKQCCIIDSLGFHQGIPELYVYDKKNVFGTKPHNILFRISDKLPDFSKYKEYTELECLEYVHSLMRFYPSVTDMLMTLTMFSVIKPVFVLMDYSPNFFVNIVGESGSFKTTFAKLFFARNEQQVLSFSRNNRTEVLKAMKFYLGHSVIIDDYHPPIDSNDRNRQMGIMDVISRNSDINETALAVITSEYLDGCFSLQDRMLQIPIRKVIHGTRNNERTRDISEKLTKFQMDSGKIDCFLYYFAKKVYEQVNEVVDFAKKAFDKYQKELSGFRIDWNLNFLKVTLDIFEKIFPAVSNWKIDNQLLNSFKKISYKQRHHMDIVKRLENPDWAMEVYRMLDSDICKKDFGIHKKSIDKQDVIIENGIVYITRFALKDRMNSFLECRVKINDILNDLEEKQLLVVDDSSARTKKTLGKRFYQINAVAMELYVERKRGSN
jgi:hypothetical protein